MSTMVAVIVVVASWFAQMQNYDAQLAYSQQFRTEATAIAVAYCGQPYFGTWCGDPPRYVR